VFIVIDELDDLKKDAERGAKARDVIRFLEGQFRTRSGARSGTSQLAIRVQKENEMQIPWADSVKPRSSLSASRVDAITAPVSFEDAKVPPMEFRAMLGCCLYFQNVLGPKGTASAVTAGTKVVLVTDEPILFRWAAEKFSLQTQSSDRFFLSMNV
jgi:hypothetical protein